MRYTAEVTNPLTHEVTVLEAGSEAELEQMVDRHLTQEFPDPAPAATTDPAACEG